jgi:hypothetical protein
MDQDAGYSAGTSAIAPSSEFDNPSNSVIRGSKMNDIEEDHPF